MTTKNNLINVEVSLRAQTVVMTLARVLRTILTIGIPVVLVRVLHQDTFGAYKQIGLISNNAVGLLGLGLPISLFYFVPRMPERSQTFIVQTSILFAIVSAIAGLALGFGSQVLAQLFGPLTAQYSVWLGLIVALSVTSLLDVLMVIDKRVRLAAASSAVLDSAHGLLVVGTALITRDLNWILAAVSLSLMLRVAVLVLYVRWRGRAVSAMIGTAALTEQFRYALPFYGSMLISLTSNQFHSFYVATKYDATEFALYSIGTLQLPLVEHLTQSIGDVIIIENTKNYSQGNLQEMRRVVRRASYALALVLLPLFFVLEVFAHDVIELLFGAAYASSADVWRVFVVILPLSIFLGGTMLRATGDLRLNLFANVMSLVVTVGTVVLLVDHLGVVAAVLGLVLGKVSVTVLVNARMLTRMQSTLGEYMEWRKIFFVIMVAIICTLFAKFVTSSLPQWQRVFLGSGLAGTLDLVALWVLGLIPEPERKWVIQMWSRVRDHFARAAQ